MSTERIIVFRTDRLGDVLLSLPALQLIRKSRPQAALRFVCRPEHHEVLAPLLQSMAIDLAGNDSPWGGAFDAALFLFAEREDLREAKRQGIRTRVGMLSKWWSPFFLTAWLRQRRSEAIQNEAEYNLDLARVLLKKLEAPLAEPSPLQLPVNPIAQAEARQLVPREGTFVIHPGMSGSALNPSSDRYAEIIQALQTKGPVVVTIGPASWDQRMKQELAFKVPGVNFIEGVSLAVLAEIFRRARAVVAPSTGPLHLAHYVGARTIGLFSPVRTHRADRWSPWGGTGKSSCITPQVHCPAKTNCLGEKCPEFPCMERADWPQFLG